MRLTTINIAIAAGIVFIGSVILIIGMMGWIVPIQKSRVDSLGKRIEYSAELVFSHGEFVWINTGKYAVLTKRRFCIMDRDGSFSERFRTILANAGVRPIRTPPQSPNCNAIMERFFGSLKRECLRRIIPFGESGLRHAIQEYLAHYHTERPHQGLDGTIIDPTENVASTVTTKGHVICDTRLGGILRHYRREAA